MIEKLLTSIRAASASMRRSDIARLSYGLDDESPWLASCDEFSADALSPVAALLFLAARFFEEANESGTHTPELRALAALVTEVQMTAYNGASAVAPAPATPRCTLCESPATVRAAGSYYCAEHGGFEQVFSRHGLVSILGVPR